MIVLITGLVAPYVAVVLRYDLWKIRRSGSPVVP